MSIQQKPRNKVIKSKRNINKICINILNCIFNIGKSRRKKTKKRKKTKNRSRNQQIKTQENLLHLITGLSNVSTLKRDRVRRELIAHFLTTSPTKN